MILDTGHTASSPPHSRTPSHMCSTLLSSPPPPPPFQEYAEFQKAEAAHENDYFTAAPCEDNLFEWHFTIRGPPDSDFAGGRYHGRILLPSQYVSAGPTAARADGIARDGVLIPLHCASPLPSRLTAVQAA